MLTNEQLEEFEKETNDLTAEEWAVILLILSSSGNDIQDEAASFYQKYATDGVLTYADARKHVSKKDRRRRIAVLFLLFGNIFDLSFVQIENKINSHLTKTIKREASLWGKELTKDEIKELLKTKWGLDDKAWKDRLWDYRTEWDIRLQNDFITSLARHEDIKDVFKRIDKRVTYMEKRMKLFVDAETTALQSETDCYLIKRDGGKKYQYHTFPWERVCENCAPLNGAIFELADFQIGITAPPLHPRCHCKIKPVE